MSGNVVSTPSLVLALPVEPSEVLDWRTLTNPDGPAPLDPTEINPNFKNPTAYQSPRSVRFGIKVTF